MMRSSAVLVLLSTVLLAGCATERKYVDSGLPDYERDKAYCEVYASRFKDKYMPGHFLFDIMMRSESYDLCMRGKGWERAE